MKPYNEGRHTELTELIASVTAGLEQLGEPLDDFDHDQPKASTLALAEAVTDEFLDELRQLAKKLAALRKAHEAGDFNGPDFDPTPIVPQSAMATAAAVPDDPALEWTSDGDVIEAADIHLHDLLGADYEVDGIDDLDLYGLEVTITYDRTSRTMAVTLSGVDDPLLHDDHATIQIHGDEAQALNNLVAELNGED